MDLINKEQAYQTLSEYYHHTGALQHMALKEALDRVPVVDAMPIRHGHWERHNTYHGDDVSGFIDPDWRCSECGEQANVNAWCMYDLTAFCPNCGAKMDETKDEYVTLHHEDINFIDEDAEKAFYESLEEKEE